MPTTTSTLNLLRNALRNAVTKIGTTNGTKRPITETSDNRQDIAYELAVSQLVLKRADARYRTAVRTAIDTGVLFDHKAEPLPAGTVRELYRDEIVTVTVRVTTPHSRLNTRTLREQLAVAGFSREQIDTMFLASTDKTNPPHEFVADIIAPEC